MAIVTRMMLTGRDNSTYDIMRVLMVVFSLSYIVLTGWQIYHGGTIDPLNWASGAAALMAGGGAGCLMKRDTEPTS